MTYAFRWILFGALCASLTWCFITPNLWVVLIAFVVGQLSCVVLVLIDEIFAHYFRE